MEKHRLPDTPWHVGFAKKKEDDPRRHKARCVHIDFDGKCKCTKAGAYPGKCGGSSHCSFYAETWKQWETVKANTQTVEEEAAERVERYKASLRKKRKKIKEDQTASVHYINMDKIVKCAVCDEKLHRKHASMYCKFCGTYYVHEGQVEECKSVNNAQDDEVIIVGKKREVVKNEKVCLLVQSCIHSGKKNKCTLGTSQRYGKPCRREGCSGYSVKKVSKLK